MQYIIQIVYQVETGNPTLEIGTGIFFCIAMKKICQDYYYVFCTIPIFTKKCTYDKIFSALSYLKSIVTMGIARKMQQQLQQLLLSFTFFSIQKNKIHILMLIFKVRFPVSTYYILPIAMYHPDDVLSSAIHHPNHIQH